MRCRYCREPILKIIIGWMHVYTPAAIHMPRPEVAG